MKFNLKRVILVLGVLLILMVAELIYANSYEYEYNIFSQIDELNVLNDFIVDDVEDGNAEGLAYNECFCHVVEYEGNEYTVCAYEFVDAESSKVYYERALDTSYDYWEDWSVSASSSLWGCAYIAFEDNRVLYFQTSALPHKAAEFENGLAQYLSVELPHPGELRSLTDEDLQKIDEYMDDMMREHYPFMEDLIGD